MPDKADIKEQLKGITSRIEASIQELFESKKYQQYLRTMSRFHKYSVNNTMLIYMQKPDATLVAGFNKWQDQFGRSVMKGEKGRLLRQHRTNGKSKKSSWILKAKSHCLMKTAK